MKTIEVLAPTPEITNAVIGALAKAGIQATAATPPPTPDETDAAIAEIKADQSRIGTPAYQGRAYFWNWEYRHYLRDATRAERKAIHRAWLAAGLDLVGISEQHEAIITWHLTP